jgi:rfaE bifunctional protein nucleotidyltransferase chain/domain
MTRNPSKIVDDTEAKRLIGAAQARGETVVFTCGCFDVLHIGHVRSLVEARQLGDHLMIGLNSDASVRALKGEGRPLFPVAERAEVLSALEPIDWIVVIEDYTMDRILDLIRPDIYVKGTDYSVETIPERQTVLDYGGRLAIVGDAKTRSSRQFTIERRTNKGQHEPGERQE